MMVKDRIGWRPFENAMRKLLADPPVSESRREGDFPEGEYDLILGSVTFSECEGIVPIRGISVVCEVHTRTITDQDEMEGTGWMAHFLPTFFRKSGISDSYRRSLGGRETDSTGEVWRSLVEGKRSRVSLSKVSGI
jgi:hypothetical protein